MQIHRCPECGKRLTTNYCDICMRRVPFAGKRTPKDRDPWSDSSAHRQEKDHKCVTFDVPEAAVPKPVFPKQKPGRQTGKKKPVLAIILAVVSFIGFVSGLMEDFRGDPPMPDYDIEALVTETDLPVLETTILDIDGEIFITAETLGLYYDEPAISFLIDNKSPMDIDVMVEQVAVNGAMINTGMFVEIPAETSGQGILCLHQYELEKMGITRIQQLDLSLRVYDQEDYGEIFCLDMWTLETDAEPEPKNIDASGWEMICDSGLSVCLQEVKLPGRNGCELQLYLENLSDDTVSFYTTNASVNGQMADGFTWITLLPGTCAVESLFIGDLFDMNLNDLSEITEIIVDYGIDYLSGSVVQETVTGSVLFNPNALPESE